MHGTTRNSGRMSPRQLGWAVPALVVLLAVAAPAMIRYFSLPELYQEAEIVCLANVGETRASGRDELWQLAVTDLTVTKVFKGKPASGTLRVETRVFDGPIEDPPAVFMPGAKEAVVFLRATGTSSGKGSPTRATHVLSNLHQGIMAREQLGAAWERF